MSAERDRRWSEEREAGPAPATLAPPAPAADPAARVLQLQRTAGNSAVTALLGRKEKHDPRVQPPRTGGWNEGPQEVASTLRIPVGGVTAMMPMNGASGISMPGAKSATRRSRSNLMIFG